MKIKAFLLAFVLIFSALPFDCGAYAKIDSNHTENVKDFMQMLNLTDMTLSDGDSVSRAQFISLVVNALNYDASAVNDGYFTDVPENHPYDGAIYKAKSLGVISGKNSTRFFPDSPISYEEAVKVIVKEGDEIGAENIPEIPEVDGKYIIGWISSGDEITGDYIPESDMNVFAKYGTYSQISADIDPISGILNGTSLADIELPETVIIYVAGEPREVEVIWDLTSVAYDENSEQEQSFVVNGTLIVEGDSINKDDLNVSVWVTVAAAEKKQETIFDSEWYWTMLLMLQNTKYDVTATAGEGGSITDEGVTKVKYGNSITYTITPDEGYEIESVMVNGKDKGAVSEYTFKNVRSKQNISVTFREVINPAVTETVVSDSDWMNPFTDVNESDAFYKAVEFVYENDLFKGVSDTEFAPYTTMTRAMFVTVLGRLAQIDVSEYADVLFDDVIADQYYTPYVAWATENGIVKGYGNGLFGVDDEVTIEQAVVILARYAEVTGIVVDDSDIDFSLYADINDVSEWALIEMMWALESGVYQVENAELNPQEFTARILVAEMLYNFCNIYLAD